MSRRILKDLRFQSRKIINQSSLPTTTTTTTAPVLEWTRQKTTDTTKYNNRDIPSAYKFYKEDKKERQTRKVRKRLPPSSPNSISSSKSNIETDSSRNDLPFVVPSNGSYSTAKLLLFENETEKSMEEYMQKLDASSSNAMKLINTEDEYAQLCVKLRQTIGRWCSGSGTQGRRKVDDFSTLPPFRAIKFLSILENVRKDRAQRIKDALKEEQEMKDMRKADMGVMTWFYEKLSGNASDSESGAIIQKLNRLSAHRSVDYTANIRLYLTALLCCRNWSEVVPSPIITSQMEGIITSMMTNFNEGNKHCQPDIQCYHHLLLHYQRINGDISIAKKALKILRDLIHDPSGVTPTQETFQIVLSIYQAVASSKCKDDVKREAINDAETILSLYENAKLEPVRDGTINQPFNSIFSIFIAVGPSLLPDYLERVHNVMTRLLGQSAYEYLLSDNGALIDLPNADHKTIHDLIHLLSMSADRDALDKAKILLMKMENTRIAYENGTKEIQWDRKYPRRSSFNSLILGMFHTSFETSSFSNTNNIDDEEDIGDSDLLDVEDDAEVDTKVNDAIYCTELLDLMLQRQESIPNAFTYYRIIKMWVVTASKEAGDRGEELLSRLNIFSIFTHDKAPFHDIRMKVKGSVLECWQTAALAGRPLAAQRAYNLLCRIYEEESLDLVHDDAKGQREKYFLLMKVIGACANTKVEEDRDNAIDIAVKLHRKMKEEDIPLTPFTYVLLLRCFHGFTSNDDKRMALTSSLFHQACIDSLVNRHVLNSLKYANPILFEHYQKNPDHSRTFTK